jgi:mono/diheme cytochrome c family protein
MRAAFIVIACVAPLWAGAVTAQDSTNGKRLFQRHCAMCHNVSGMGTGLLSRRMKSEVAELEKREDLSAVYVERFARQGLLNMPAITRAEVNDGGMKAIAQYLSRGKP